MVVRKKRETGETLKLESKHRIRELHSSGILSLNHQNSDANELPVKFLQSTKYEKTEQQFDRDAREK